MQLVGQSHFQNDASGVTLNLIHILLQTLIASTSLCLQLASFWQEQLRKRKQSSSPLGLVQHKYYTWDSVWWPSWWHDHAFVLLPWAFKHLKTTVYIYYTMSICWRREKKALPLDCCFYPGGGGGARPCAPPTPHLCLHLCLDGGHNKTWPCNAGHVTFIWSQSMMITHLLGAQSSLMEKSSSLELLGKCHIVRGFWQIPGFMCPAESSNTEPQVTTLNLLQSPTPSPNLK